MAAEPGPTRCGYPQGGRSQIVYLGVGPSTALEVRPKRARMEPRCPPANYSPKAGAPA